MNIVWMNDDMIVSCVMMYPCITKFQIQARQMTMFNPLLQLKSNDLLIASIKQGLY